MTGDDKTNRTLGQRLNPFSSPSFADHARGNTGGKTKVLANLKGNIAGGIDLLYDTLMVPALDEVSTEYGLIAESVSYPADFSAVTYRLRNGFEQLER